jgi:hypothetical protein
MDGGLEVLSGREPVNLGRMNGMLAWFVLNLMAMLAGGAADMLARNPGVEFLDRPDVTNVRAWIRFVEADEQLEGTPYYWLGRGDLRIVFELTPGSGHALELLWGSKGDTRQAALLVNGRRMVLEGGGHRGFRWLRVPLPEEIRGERYEIIFQAGTKNAAFLAEARLTAPGDKAARSEDLRQSSHQARLVAAPGGRATPGEAFPEMRPVWDREPAWASQPSLSATDSLFRQAEKNARLANEAFFRCRRYVDGWLAQADPETGLIPRNLSDSRDYWNGRDSAADNYAFLVLTAAMIDQPLLQGRMLAMLHTEQRLTARQDRLTDDYSFSKRSWRREKFDLDATIFDSAEYCKDGLLSITEWMGPSPWSERMLGLAEDIWKNAVIETPFGKIPTRNFEVNGDLLQVCARLYWFTAEPKYLDWAVRLGDMYLLGSQHPTRDLDELRLSDHGCEVVNGLSELYFAVAYARAEKRKAYQKPLLEIYDRILAVARNADGLLYHSFNPKTGANSGLLCDTFGYVYDGFYTVHLVDQIPRYQEAARFALGNLKGKYEGRPWADKSADGMADSEEGALNLYNREPIASTADWIDSQTRLRWSAQKSDGIIEGWHGDGNFARTTLMYALWKTQGVTVQPWRPDLRFGAARPPGGGLCLIFASDQPWEGRVLFDRPRHRDYLHLPVDYPRINQFPEWFVVRADRPYRVRYLSQDRSATPSGRDLQEGLGLSLKPGTDERWMVEPLP